MLAGNIPSDRFLVPFTSTNMKTSATARIALPTLESVVVLVRACYPDNAGCFNAVPSVGLGIDSVAPEAKYELAWALYMEEHTCLSTREYIVELPEKQSETEDLRDFSCSLFTVYQRR